MKSLSARTAAAALLLALACVGCKPGAVSSGAERPWREFVADLTNTLRLASGESMGTTLHSTFDATGGNDDFNRFVAPGRDPGWMTVVDLKGPGVVRRFWTTGQDPGHRFRIFFDGEKKPRIEGAIEELFGERAPFTPPLARYLNLCWYSYIPLTYQKAIRIEVQSPNVHPLWGERRIFFQVNNEALPAGTAVQTFPRTLAAADQEAVQRVGRAWEQAVEWPVARYDERAPLPVAPGAEVELFQAGQPGLLPEWFLDVRPAQPEAWTQVESELLLQDCLLRVYYDGRAEPSIEAPLGDFFGNAWRQRHYGSLLLGASTNGYRCGFPMPFGQSISIRLLNQADRPVTARFSGAAQAPASATPYYLHAEWRRSGPDAGTPHRIAEFAGSGWLAACFLGVTGHGVTERDNSWWLLEGDEQIFIDGETRPSWHGTGLEDYFNGGWYYRGCAFGALHGIMDRSPFRVAQYRHHLVDPVRFGRSLLMQIERGDQNVSHAWFRSTAFAYLAAPATAFRSPVSREDRRAVPDRYSRQTTMLQLVELERMNNFDKARDLVREYRERHPGSEEDGVYALRALEYDRLLGRVSGAEGLDPFLAGTHGATAQEQARLLQWFHEAPGRALFGLYVNGEGRVFVEGQEVMRGDHPYALQVAGVNLGDGPRRIAAEVKWKRPEAWLQLGIRTAGGFVGTGPGLRSTLRPGADWMTSPAQDAAWIPFALRDSPRGVPDAPLIGGVPNAFVLLQSKAYSLRTPEWDYRRATAYFRMDLSAPLTGLPAWSRELTGLRE